MFLYPWSRMVGGIFYEHAHRLIGSFVGLLTAAVALVLWATEPRRWLRRLGLLAVVMVGAQGLLGGLRVVLLAENLAILHGALAQAFFGLTVALGLFTSREWVEGDQEPAPTASLRRLALTTTVGLYLQIVFGALLTHRGHLDAHLAGALVLLLLIPALGVQVIRRHPDSPSLVGAAIGLQVLFMVQLLLGGGAYVVRFTSLPIPLASLVALALPVAHRLTGALLLGVSLVITLKLYRLGTAPEGSPAALPIGMKGLPA
jgi:cytochrome c oxidase assembly protein subunit 15